MCFKRSQFTKREKVNQLLARQSIHAKKRINKGEFFTKQNLILKRPGTGLSPKKLKKIIGKKAKKNYFEDQIIKSL